MTENSARIFAYPITAVVWANFMPKIGPENLGTKVLVEGAPGPDVIAIKSCDNYIQTEIDRYVSSSLSQDTDRSRLYREGLAREQKI